MDRTEPIFKSIFGKDWDDLPLVMQQHYANRPYTRDVVIAEGIMKIVLSPFIKLYAPLLNITQTLVAKEGENVAVTVVFRSEIDSARVTMEREFRFSDGTIKRFCTKMEPVGSHELIEWTQSGVGWHAAYLWENEQVVVRHRGYYVRLFSKRLRVPLECFMGHGNAWEKATSDKKLEMYVDLYHLLLGRLYSYSGHFTIKKVQYDN